MANGDGHHTARGLNIAPRAIDLIDIHGVSLVMDFFTGVTLITAFGVAGKGLLPIGGDPGGDQKTRSFGFFETYRNTGTA